GRLGLLRWYVDRQRLVSTFVTNVRGPAAPLSFVGSPVTALLPLPATTGNVTVAFAVLSYAGTLAVTVLADPRTCPDLALLAGALQPERARLGGCPGAATECALAAARFFVVRSAGRTTAHRGLTPARRPVVFPSGASSPPPPSRICRQRRRFMGWQLRPAVPRTARMLGAALLAVPLLVPALATPAAADPPPAFTEVDQVSNVPGRAALTDPDLVNAWGLALSPTSPLWVANNGTDTSTLYAGGGNGAGGGPGTLRP